jgi:hypothetical protein
MKLNLKLFVCMLMIYFAVGCKTSNESSEDKSLDNMARSKGVPLNENQCSGDFKIMDDLFSPELDIINIHAKDDAEATQLQSKVESALKAVPSQIQLAFFGMGGIVEVSPLTNEVCSEGLNAEQKARYAEFGTKITGCWKYQTDYMKLNNGELKKDERVVIYVDSSPASIEHSLVRTFGYVLSQVLSKMDLKEGETEITQVVKDAQFEDAKEGITMSFLDDVAASEGKYDLSNYSYIVGEKVLSKDKLLRRAAWTKLMNESPAKAQQFMDYVFAETFDSQYCSSETRKIMKDDFSTTGAAFASVHKSITGLTSELAEVESEKELSIEEQPDDQQTAAATPAAPSSDFNSEDLVFTDISSAYSLGIFRGFFRGIGRIIRAIGRGVVRFARAVIRVAAKVIRFVVRVVAAVVRATGHIALKIVRGTLRVARGVLVGAGRIVGRAVGLRVGYASVRHDGTVIAGAFGSKSAFITESGMVLEEAILDSDGDGISDEEDLCSGTAQGARVHTKNQSYLGCAGGQFRDRDRAYRPSSSTNTSTRNRRTRRGLFGRRYR